MQNEGDTAEAIYTIGDRIVAVGTRKAVFEQVHPDAEQIDLHGKTLIPGFIESHAHLTDWAESEFLQFTCYNIKNIAELQDMVRHNAITKKAGEWVVGYGYNDSMVEESRHLHASDLDAACADHPVFIMHGSGHLAYVNSAALRLCGITAHTPVPEGGSGEIHLDAQGEPSGLMIGQAYNLALSVIPKYSVEEYKYALRRTRWMFCVAIHGLVMRGNSKMWWSAPLTWRLLPLFGRQTFHATCLPFQIPRLRR